MASGGFLIRPGADFGTADDLARERWENQISELINYRRGYRRIEQPCGERSIGFRSNCGAVDEFKFDECPHGDELFRLREITVAHPRGYLAA